MMRAMQRLRRIHAVVAPALLAAAVLPGCGGPPSPPPAPLEPEREHPYVLVLGTAQDGGLPHLGCYAGNCEAARADPTRRRLVTSLLLCDPRDGRRWLFDCTPDIREQLDRAAGHPPTRAAEGPRPPLFDGVFLTHAHMGHYSGLLHFGRESYSTREMPTYVTRRFAQFLTRNGPWKQLVEEKRLTLREIEDGKAVELAPDLQVVPFRVPHRDEFSDTVGFEIRGPRRRLAYLPDIDKWEAWDAEAETQGRVPAPARMIESLIERVDFALLDGCFFADGEIPGRSMKDIPHPAVSESIGRFAALRRTERSKVHFTHLNHTNPAADAQSDARRAILNSGMRVLEEGRIFGL